MQDFFNMPGILGVGFIAFAVAVVMVFVSAVYLARRERASLSEFKEMGDVVNKIKWKNQELNDLEKRREKIQSDIDNMDAKKKESQDLDKKLLDKEKELLDKGKELQSYGDAIERARQARTELVLLETRRREIADQEQKLTTRTLDFQKIEGELKEKEKKRDDLAAECVQTETKVKEAELKHKVIMDSIADFEKKKKDAEGQKNEALLEKQRVEEELSKLRDKLKDAKAQLDLKDALTTLQSNLRDKKAEFGKVKGSCQGFYDKLAQYQTEAAVLKEQIQRLKGSSEEIKKGRDRAIEERDKAKKDLQKLQPSISGNGKTPGRELDVGALRKRPDDMEVRFPERTGGAAPDENDLLSDFGDALKKAGLVFSPRTIRSFHTALKCQSISPLTVLAGVSGTGKTLLPLQYADFMGLSKLVISVQPRWDSPQDLLGFPNYVEHKFEARSLSQLLWSYQHDQDPRFKKLLSLVLFDEMNLARTEYYFSDFLSKLELRHANEKSPGAMIDLGVGEKFPIPANVLMVGTMNEDESTQTLSDKVLDRANVLRFGRPARMDVAHTTRHVMETSGKVVTADVWNSWIDSHREKKSQEEEDRISKWVNSLNDAMGKVGRPFGFRVREAMIEYVHQYPRYDGQSCFMTAFADQIEQKIIPKLRGVDTSMPERCSQCFDEIERIIGETKDEELLEAFRRDRRESVQRGLFVWTGVARED